MMLTILGRAVRPNMTHTNEELPRMLKIACIYGKGKPWLIEARNVMKGDKANYRDVWYF